MGVNSLPKTVTRQRRGCDLNLGPRAPESGTLTTRLPSHHMVSFYPYYAMLARVISISAARAQAAADVNRRDRQIGRTSDRHKEPASHTMRAASITVSRGFPNFTFRWLITFFIALS